MKKNCLKSLTTVVLLVSCLGVLKATAQEGYENYVPFVQEGKTWYCGYNHYNDFPSPPVTEEDPSGLGIDCIFIMQGDTLIGEFNYKKVFCQYKEYYGDAEQHYYCAVREEACKVFCVKKDLSEERMLYDFSSPDELLILSYGDDKFARLAGDKEMSFHTSQLTFTLCGFYNDSDIVNYSHGRGVWVEGAGSCYGNPFAFELYENKPEFGDWIQVVSCMTDGKFIYHADWMSGPVSVQKISVDNIDFPVFDLQGRRLQGKTERGLYIQNGRKVVIK